MKKAILILSIGALFLSSCKSNTSTKLDMKSEYAIKGDWVVSKVEYPGSSVINVRSFDVADSKCFENSQWSFVSNNNTGKMMLAKNGCPSFSSNITWFVNKEGNMVMKFINDGMKSKNVASGYVLKVANQTETSFDLIENINVGGQNKELKYHFVKSEIR